jgi:hypothetical protein
MKHLIVLLMSLFSMSVLFAQEQEPPPNRSKHSVQSYDSDGNYTFSKSDFVGIIKANGYEGWHRHWFIYSEDYKWGADIHRYKAEVVLTLKGNPKSKDIIICIDVDPPSADADFSGPPLNMQHDFPEGKQFLVYLYHPREDKTIESGASRSYRIALKSTDDFYMPAAARYGYNLFPLPDGEYKVEGSTSVEKATAILTQAYEKKGNIMLAWSITKFCPRFSMRDGRRVMHPPDGESPEFYDFYSEKLEPRLLKKAGENLIDRIHILAISLSIGKEERRPEYESLLWQIDETYPDPDAKLSIPLDWTIENKNTFYMRLANARLATLRRAAIYQMSLDDSTSENKVYKSQVIKMLDDPNQKVRTQAIRYLSFTVKDPDAPKPKFKGSDTVENEQEIIQYWKNKGG